MAEFKRTQIVDTKASKNLTPDNLYWKRLDFPVTIKHYGFINGLDFSPIEPYNFAVSYSTKVDIYNPDTKRPCAVLTKFKRCAYGGSFRQDGQLFVAGGEDGRVKLFSVKNKLMLRLFKGHESSVHNAKFLFNRQHIVSFSDDKTVRLWDSTTEAQLSLLSGHTDYVRCGAAASQSSDLIASGSYDHTVKLWDLRQAEGQQTCMTMNHGCPIEALLMFPNDSLLVSAGGTNIKVWDLAAGGKQLLQLSNHRKTISSLSFCSENRRLLSGGLDRFFGFLKISSKEVAELLTVLKTDWKMQMSFLEKSTKQLVKVYDLATYQVVHTLTYPAPIVKLGISNDDNILAVAMTDGLLSVQHRLCEKNTIQKPKASKHMSFRYLIGRGSCEDSPNVEVKEEIKKRLPRYDQCLRTFQHKKALQILLRNHYFVQRHPEVIVSFLKECIRRQALERALSEHDDEYLCVFTKFICRNIGKAAFTSVLMDTTNDLLDIYGEKLIDMQPKTVQSFKRLGSIINQESCQLKQMTSLMGALELVMSMSSTSKGFDSAKNLDSSESLTEDLCSSESITVGGISKSSISGPNTGQASDILTKLLMEDDDSEGNENNNARTVEQTISTNLITSDKTRKRRITNTN